MTNIKAEIIGQKLICYKCKEVVIAGEDVSGYDLMSEDILSANIDDVVVKDFCCKKCGCNTYDVTVYIRVRV